MAKVKSVSFNFGANKAKPKKPRPKQGVRVHKGVAYGS